MNTSTDAQWEPTVLGQVHLALERDLRLDPTRHPITLAFADGVLTMGGELADIAAKKRALRCAASVPGVRWLVDRLSVECGVHTEDGEIRDHVRNALLGDTAFTACRIVVRSGAVAEVIRDPIDAHGALEVSVEEGVVTLDGEVPSSSHRRLAGVYAWWATGTRNVHNRLGVTPAELDNDGEISDAVRLALEKDPLVNAGQLAVRVAGGRVTIGGTVHTGVERRLAERDAWYVLGVDDVVNEIEVHP